MSEIENEIVENQLEHEDSLGEDTTRKLATVQTVTRLRPIEGADRIVLAEFSQCSWAVIMGIGEVAVGQKVVYFEPDSWLPNAERYAILKGRCDKVFKGKPGFRLKVIRLRGTISYGFAMPLTKEIFPELFDEFLGELQDGDDVTELLGVKLYEMPVIRGGYGFAIGKPIGNFPTHLVSKTDQTRVQSLGVKQLWNLLHSGFELTEKADGTSSTIIATKVCQTDEDETIWDFIVCSRNLKLKEPANEKVTYRDAEGNKIEKVEFVDSIYWRMANKYKIKERLIAVCHHLNRELALQGEIVGPGVQGNKYNLDEPKLLVFDVWDIGIKRYVPPSERRRIIDMMNNLDLYGFPKLDVPDIEHVPIIDPCFSIAPTMDQCQAAINDAKLYVRTAADEGVSDWQLFTQCLLRSVVQSIVNMAEGESKLHKTEREGLVFKSVLDPMQSFKCISNKFLLKQEKYYDSAPKETTKEAAQ